MRRQFAWAIGAVTLAAGLAPAPAANAQENGERGYNAILDNIDLLVDNYCNFLGRKYDLTEEQAAYTRQLMSARADEFLANREGELRNLVDRLFDVRGGGEMSPDELIAWGERASPIYEDAKQLIIAGNEEWRGILNEKQRRIHDEDLKLMYESFENTEDQLDRIVTGEMTVEEFANPRAARRARRDKPRANTVRPDRDARRAAPPRAGADPEAPDRDVRRAERAGGAVQRPGETEQRSAPERPRRRVVGRRGNDDDNDRRAPRGPARAERRNATGWEGEWDRYVEEFIKKYQLNDEQQQKAHAILKDCKTQASKFVTGQKGRIERLDAMAEQLKSSEAKDKGKQLQEIEKKKKELLEPLNGIFEKQLKPRLETLPTRAQRRAAEAEASKGKDRRNAKDDDKKEGKDEKSDP